MRKLFESEAPVEAPPIGADNGTMSAENVAKLILLRAVVVVSVSDPLNSHRQLLEFATSVHCRYWFRVAYPSAITAEDTSRVHNDIDVWLRFVLRAFQSTALSNPSSHGNSALLLPLEWTFQHEFWRGASMMLPPSMRVAAEVSKVMTRSTVGRTRLDFWVNSSLNWAVELMRSPQSDPDSIKDHVDRVRENGRYYGLEPAQWRVVNFDRQGVILSKLLQMQPMAYSCQGLVSYSPAVAPRALRRHSLESVPDSPTHTTRGKYRVDCHCQSPIRSGLFLSFLSVSMLFAFPIPCSQRI
ncbi:uncharacterized protein EV422DRAFT_326825 [Fimicolochytrium jonesii]|uniref:uncharacterized protein n=1 Tax=Fimicolochytrium jonesii TaxID=1396493 RepID=UPI0022FE7A12|nr:uncharacterized protein EV422DRAFT_326825 [Fimicolochytrium jonesii]KAI8816123.1 hypothetical protein EV422DRAFT_326825 [Fimicolochytrium jonesii]